MDDGLVKTAGAAAFVRALCHDSPADGWGASIDGLVLLDGDLPIDRAELRRHLASGVHGAPVPAALGFAIELAGKARDTVEQTLTTAPSEVLGGLAVIRLDDAHHIPLQRYSLAARRRYPGKVTVLVHRDSRLYCGRDSGTAGIDLFRHFAARGLDPKGHPYVCTVTLPGSKIEEEIEALKKELDR